MFSATTASFKKSDASRILAPKPGPHSLKRLKPKQGSSLAARKFEFVGNEGGG